jgi:hypothetical protein
MTNVEIRSSTFLSKMHIARAKQCRPPPKPFEKAMIQHIVTRDSLPLAVPCDEKSRFTDETYCWDISSMDETQSATVCMFATTEHGNSVMISVLGYRPWVRVEMPESWNDGDAQNVRLQLEKRCKGRVDVSFDTLKRFYGFVPGKTAPNGFGTPSFLSIRLVLLATLRVFWNRNNGKCGNCLWSTRSTQTPNSSTIVN